MPYVAKDVVADPVAREEMLVKWGSMGTPTIVVDDRQVITGFLKSELKKVLEIGAPAPAPAGKTVFRALRILPDGGLLLVPISE